MPPTATPAPTATPTGCRLADGRTAYAAFSDIYGRWKDADALAGNTPRISLAPEIAAMQSLRREVAAINWPACASAAALDLGSGMDQVIQAYLDFLANEKSDVTVGTELNAGRATLQTFELDLAALPR